MPRSVYAHEIWWLADNYPEIVDQALYEVGERKLDLVRPVDRGRLVEICKRRIPPKRRKHLVQDKTPLESYGYRFAQEPEKYGIVKGVTNIEHKGI